MIVAVESYVNSVLKEKWLDGSNLLRRENGGGVEGRGEIRE